MARVLGRQLDKDVALRRGIEMSPADVYQFGADALRTLRGSLCPIDVVNL